MLNALAKEEYPNKEDYKTLSLNNPYCEHKQVEPFKDTFILPKLSFWH